MKKIFDAWAAVAAVSCLVNLTGCAVTPDTIVKTPLTAAPRSALTRPPANGTIFQAAAYRPMFEDRRARLIGDTLTITITEKTTAGKTDTNSASKTGSTGMSVSSLFATPVSIMGRLGAKASVDSKFDEKGASDASNNFTGTITVTVIDVLENGNLIVGGEKQVAFDKGIEFVRFSGVVNPTNIVNGNTVSSTQVADARVEYRSNSRVDASQISSILSRFFFSLVPL